MHAEKKATFKAAGRLLLALLMLTILTAAVFLTGCDSDKPAPDDSEATDSETPPATDPETEPETDPSAAGTDSETDPETDPPVSETEPETEPAESETEPETDPPAAETEPEITPKDEPTAAIRDDSMDGKYINPLTGLPADQNTYYKRPVAIMLNNIKKANPQIGTSNADVIYECMVEGGITRLMMLVTNYENLDVIGSVRSSREYYLDFAQNHDAIYIHAGGSTQAYKEIYQRSINNICGVNGGAVTAYFYRDPERRATMGLEHSLMTTGEMITKAIQYKKYRTDKYEGFDSPFDFVSCDGGENTLEQGGEARHVIITYTSSHYPQYIYNEKTNTYARYQFKGEAHIDGATGETLTFTNVLVIACTHTNTNDSYNHIDVDTVGSGDGYYIYGGKYIKIKWSKADEDTPIQLFNEDGTPLQMNCGKTFVNIVSPAVYSKIQLNYQKNK